MPPQKGQSGLLAKYGDRLAKAHEQNKTNEVVFDGFGDLPAGMSGIAQLSDCRFLQIAQGKDNAGEYMFFARGIVMEPEEFTDDKGNTHRVAGLGTMISEPLFDTPKRSRQSINEHVAWIYNELGKLGVNMQNVQLKDLEGVVAALKQGKPFFRFRTWIGEPSAEYPNPRVNHVWNGVCDYEPGASETAGVADNSAPASSTNGTATKNGAHAPTTTTAAPTRTADPGPDIEALVTAAKADDDAAQDKLIALAIAAGHSEDDVRTADTWDIVAGMINGTTAADAGGDGEMAVEPEMVFKYRPIDPKTKKAAPKSIEVEVVSSDPAKKTAVVKRMDDPKKSYKDVPWDALENATAD